MDRREGGEEGGNGRRRQREYETRGSGVEEGVCHFTGETKKKRWNREIQFGESEMWMQFAEREKEVWGINGPW